MLGVGHGRPEQRHMANAYSSGSDRLDTGIVPKALPCSLDYKLVTVGDLFSNARSQEQGNIKNVNR